MTTVTHIALLRGINVGGKNMIAMPELRALCEELGWQNVQTYIQSGNLLFAAQADPASLELALEQAILTRFGLNIPVIVRTTAAWATYPPRNPFPGAAQEAPNLLMLALAKAPPHPQAVEQLRTRADSEQIEQTGDALWIYYAAGSGRSKLTPNLLDRSVASPVTTRNWRTVLKLAELAGIAVDSPSAQ